jgi:uncharacterized protein
MRGKRGISIGLVLMIMISGGAYIAVNWLVREEMRPTLEALDCANRKDDIARIVCRRKYSAGLDHTLAQEYYAAMTTASGEAADALKAEHAEFIRKRAACFPLNTPAELKDVYRCVEGVYEAAIAALRARRNG